MRRILAAAAVLAAVALTAQAQVSESKQSGSPTQKQFQMRIAEPANGAKIEGSDFNVVLALPEAKTEGTSVHPSERKSSSTPIYQVWMDGKNLGNIPATRNVMNVHAEKDGAHKISVVAKNAAGQVIGRQTISVTTTGAGAAPAEPEKKKPAKS